MTHGRRGRPALLGVPPIGSDTTNNRPGSRVYAGVLGEVVEIDLAGGSLEAEAATRLARLFTTIISASTGWRAG